MKEHSTSGLSLRDPAVLRSVVCAALLLAAAATSACGDEPSSSGTLLDGGAGQSKGGSAGACCGAGGSSKGGAAGSMPDAEAGGSSGGGGTKSTGGAGGVAGFGGMGLGGSGTGGGPGVGGSPAGGSGGGPAACPWGAQLPAAPAVGLAAVTHNAQPKADQQKILDRMNSFRSGPPLKWNSCLGDLAQSHSDDMLQRGYYGHGTLGNTGAWMIPQRVATSGLTLQGSADEDVLTGDLVYWLGNDVANTVNKWMTDDHKLPILNCEEVGIGIATQSMFDSYQVWVTADFACSQ